MINRKTRLWLNAFVFAVFLAEFIHALYDRTDQQTHMGAFLWGLGVLTSGVGLTLRIKEKL